MIVSAVMDDTGNWTLVANNGIKTESRHSFHLEVTPERVPVQVSIDKATTGNEYVVGTDVVIPCSVTGIPVPKIQWFKNHSPIRTAKAAPSSNASKGRGGGSGANNYQITGNGATLTVKMARIIDSGNYMCKAWNVYGKASDSLRVEVVESEGGPVKICID